MSRLMVIGLVVAVVMGAYRWKSSRAMTARAANAKIVLYSVAGCQMCERMRGWLEERHLPYQDRRFESLTRSDLLLLSKRSNLRVFPQLEVNGRFFSGEHGPAAREALDALR